LYIASRAHRAATGEDLPPHPFTIRYRELDPAWDFDFDDRTEMKRRLPRLAALFWTEVACGFVEHVTGNRTRTISLGIGQIVADEAADQPDRATGSSRD